jgi:Bacterial capsule synthesis protein PGA_cap
MIRLVAGGDLCPIGPIEVTLTGPAPESAFGDVLPLLEEKDLSIVNLECPLTAYGTPSPKSGPNIRADPSCARGIKRGGFDVASLANNHMFDFGGRGLDDTLSACQSAGIHTVGAGADLSAASEPLVVTVEGEETVILAYAEREFGVATNTSPGISPVDPIGNYRQIRDLRRRYANILVMVHGGHEYYPLPSPRMVEYYRFLAEAGASIVIGHHPHVVGAYEVHEGVPILYSLGNFLFDWHDAVTDDFFEGMLLRAELSEGTVRDFSLEPFRQCGGEPSMRLLKGDERSRCLAKVERLSHTLADEAAMGEHWVNFCSGQRNAYLAHALRLSRPRRWLLKRNILKTLMAKGADNPTFLNVLRCESHHELVLDALEHRMKGDTPATRRPTDPA